MKTRYLQILKVQFPDYEDVLLELLSTIVVEAVELFFCRQNYFKILDETPDIDLDGKPLDSVGPSDVLDDLMVIAPRPGDGPSKRRRPRPSDGR